MTHPAQPRASVYGRQSSNSAKSIAEQVEAGHDVISENGWTAAATYQDGQSASRYSRKARDEWQALLDDMEAGAFSILILWECSRGDRTLTSWSEMLDMCRAKGVQIYVISDERLYDPRKPSDWKTLARAGVDSAGESDLISMRVKRGHAGAAKAGRPSHGPPPFGYRRVYDPGTGELTGQVIEEEAAKAIREIFARIAKGDAVSSIVADFNHRKVPTPANRWYRVRVRDIAMNRAYIGERVLNGAVTPGKWDPIVDEELFYTVQRILTDPKRRTTRPGRAVHLLSYLARCSVCDAQMTAVSRKYRCLENSCVTIQQAPTDELVTKMVLARLERSDVYEQLRQHGAEEDRAVLDARAEVGRLTDQLEVWRMSAAKGETTPASLASIEANLSGQIKAAQRRIEAAEVPAVLRALVSPNHDVRVRWEAAPLPARRRAIAHMAEILIGPTEAPGTRLFEHNRLAKSRWSGDPLTWGERWAEAGV